MDTAEDEATVSVSDPSSASSADTVMTAVKVGGGVASSTPVHTDDGPNRVRIIKLHEG